MHLDLALEAADEVAVPWMQRHEAGDRAAVFGDHETLGADGIEQAEAALLELGCVDGAHDDEAKSGRKAVHSAHQPRASSVWPAAQRIRPFLAPVASVSA